MGINRESVFSVSICEFQEMKRAVALILVRQPFLYVHKSGIYNIMIKRRSRKVMK